MAGLSFESVGKTVSHQCQSYRDGDWIVHKCPICDYELRDNWRTGELVIKNSKIDINHSGNYFPAEYMEVLENQN